MADTIVRVVDDETRVIVSGSDLLAPLVAEAAALTAELAAAIDAILAASVVTGSTVAVVSRTLLASTSHASLIPAQLTESGLEGIFVPTNSNLATLVTNDPDKINTVAYSTDATGASGGWQRKPVYSGRLSKLFAATLALGSIALPSQFNNQLVAAPYYDGSAVQYYSNPFDKIDWTRQWTGTITFTGQPSNGETVTINGKVYTFQSVLTNADGNVKIGASTAATCTNLINAIRRTGSTAHGTAGTDFAVLTVPHPTLNAYQGAGTTITLTLKPAGTLMVVSEAATNVTIATDINVYYWSFQNGADSGAGTSSTAPWRTKAYVFANAVSPAVVICLDDVLGVNCLSTTASHTYSGKLMLVGGGPSGRTIATSMDENKSAVNWAFAASGANGAFVTTVAAAAVLGSRAQFDLRYQDAKGIPRPLTLAANIATCQSTPGTFIYDSGTTSLYVHMWDNRIPDPNDGWLYAYGTVDHFEIQQGLSTSAGSILVKNFDFCYNAGTSNTNGNFRYRPLTTGSTNTAIFGMRNCRAYGASGNGFQFYDGSITCIDNCHTRYNSVDGLNYHSFVATGTKGAFITVYETNCSAYDCGFTGWFGQAALSTSANGSTCHDSINIMRSGLRAANCNGAVVADVNGTVTVCLDVQASQPIGTASPKACFWHDNTSGAGTYYGMWLWGCSANDNGESTVNLLDNTAQAGSTKGQIYVAQWRGQTIGNVKGALKDWLGVAA